MKRLLAMGVLLLGFATAGGRLACRATVGTGWIAQCYVEQTLYTLGPIEVGLGVEVRNLPEWARVTPYVLLGYCREG